MRILLKFLSENYSPVKKFYEKCVCCFSQSSNQRFSPEQFDCVLRAVQCVLCALCAKMQVRDICVERDLLGLSPHVLTKFSLKLHGRS